MSSTETTTTITEDGKEEENKGIEIIINDRRVATADDESKQQHTDPSGFSGGSNSESLRDMSDPDVCEAEGGDEGKIEEPELDDMRQGNQKKMNKAAKLLGVDTPPTLDEALSSYQLLRNFLKFMNKFQASESVAFLKQVSLFARIQRPHDELVREATRIIFQYVVPESTFEVNISSSVRDDLLRVLWDRDAVENVSNDLFSAAAGEIRTLVVPHFNEWIKTGSWAGLKYDKFPPPTFNQIIQHAMLCQRLKAFMAQYFLRQHMKKSGDWSGSDSSPFSSPPMSPNPSSPALASETSSSSALSASNTIYTTTILYRCSKISCIEIDSGLVDCGRLIDFCNDVLCFKRDVYEKVRDLGLVEKKAEELWNANCDTLPFLRSDEHGGAFAPFLLSAEDALQARFVESVVYNEWIKKGEWTMIPECVKAIRQTRTPDNKYLENPTLAACITSAPLRNLLLDSTEGSQRKRELLFLIDVMTLIHAAGKTVVADMDFNECGIPVLRMERSAEIREEGRKIYKRYFEISLSSDYSSSQGSSSSSSMTILPSMDGGSKQPLQMDNKLKSELHSALFNIVSSRQNTVVNVLRKCGAYVYGRVSATWLKDYLSTYVWVDKEYDNNSPSSRAVQELYDISIIHNVNLKLVPFLEDIAANPVLKPSFISILPGPYKELCIKMLMLRDELHEATEAESRSRTLNLLDHFIQNMIPLIASSLPDLDFIVLALSKLLTHCEKCANTIMDYPTCLVMVHMFQRVYPLWVGDSSWRSINWTPAKSVYLNMDNMNGFLLGNMSSLSCLRLFSSNALFSSGSCGSLDSGNKSGSDSTGSNSDSETLNSPGSKPPGDGKAEGKKTVIGRFLPWKNKSKDTKDKDSKRIRAMSVTRPVFREAKPPSSISEAITSPSIRTLPLDDISSATKFAKPCVPSPGSIPPPLNSPSSMQQPSDPVKLNRHTRHHSSTALSSADTDRSTLRRKKKTKLNPSPVIIARDDDLCALDRSPSPTSPKLFSPNGSGRSTKSDSVVDGKKKRKNQSSCMFGMFPIPTLEETLESGYLRKQFTIYLSGTPTHSSVVTETELSLWTTLCSFFDLLSPLSYAELAASNSNNREAAQRLFSKYRVILAPFSDELNSLLEDQKLLIMSNFFRFAELKLYAKVHENYVTWLQTQSLQTNAESPRRKE